MPQTWFCQSWTLSSCDVLHREACVFERTLPEVWAARWRHQAQEEGWQTEGEKHIGASVCKQTPGGDWNHGKVVGYGGDGEDDRDGSVRSRTPAFLSPPMAFCTPS